MRIATLLTIVGIIALCSFLACNTCGMLPAEQIQLTEHEEASNAAQRATDTSSVQGPSNEGRLSCQCRRRLRQSIGIRRLFAMYSCCSGNDGSQEGVERAPQDVNSPEQEIKDNPEPWLGGFEDQKYDELDSTRKGLYDDYERAVVEQRLQAIERAIERAVKRRNRLRRRRIEGVFQSVLEEDPSSARALDTAAGRRSEFTPGAAVADYTDMHELD